ncbi:alpha/beta fold hydrolase [Acetobacter cerevisiae]|uniref:alpha/beta fold hydrolase n=1 Tax=Acetobacter cerevisiae TaxID=178900 RepID=UPI0038D16E64
MLRSVLNRSLFPAVQKAGRLWLAACGMLALPACSTTMPPVPKPPARFAQLGLLVPPQKIFTLSDGAKIPARLWQASAQPHAILLALHGFNDSRDAWESSAPFFTAHGVTVVAPDQRGFGQAPQRGGWAGTTRMVEDVREEAAQLQRAYPQTPLYLVGESMGGAVLMQLMAQPDAPHVAGTILLAPAVWNFGWATDLPLRVLARLFPDSLVTGRELPVHVVASDNIMALARLYYDPLTLRATRLKALQGLVTLMKQAATAAPRLHGSVLCIYGDHDQLVPPTAMVPVWKNMPEGTRLDLIPGGHHLLLRDRQGARVMQDMLSWINTPEHWLPSGGDSAVAAWLATGVGEAGAEKQDAPLPILPATLDRLMQQEGP